MSLTFAIAKNAPVGVVIETYTSRYSRIHRWDLETDTVTPGQFLKGRAGFQPESACGILPLYPNMGCKPMSLFGWKPKAPKTRST